MRFEVPQFIDVEDKIFGPLTFKQFIYVVGGGALAYVSYKLIPFPFWLPVSLAFAAFAWALAFYKINNRPFIEVAQSWISYRLKSRLYIWQRTPPKPISVVPVKPEPEKPPTPPRRPIEELAQTLDILDTQQ